MDEEQLTRLEERTRNLPIPWKGPSTAIRQSGYDGSLPMNRAVQPLLKSGNDGPENQQRAWLISCQGSRITP